MSDDDADWSLVGRDGRTSIDEASDEEQPSPPGTLYDEIRAALIEVRLVLPSVAEHDALEALQEHGGDVSATVDALIRVHGAAVKGAADDTVKASQWARGSGTSPCAAAGTAEVGPAAAATAMATRPNAWEVVPDAEDEALDEQLDGYLARMSAVIEAERRTGGGAAAGGVVDDYYA